MPTITLYPSTKRLAIDGPLAVLEFGTLDVVIADGEEAVFLDAHVYVLTIKRKGAFGESSYVRSVLTVTGSKTATADYDLRVAAILTAIGSADFLAVQMAVDDTLGPQLGFTSSFDAARIGNTPRRDGDVQPDPSVPAASVDELASVTDRVAALESTPPGSLDITALEDATEDPTDATLFVSQGVPGEGDEPPTPVATPGSRIVSWLSSALAAVFDAAGAAAAVASSLASHVLTHPAPSTRDSRNYRTQTPAESANVSGAAVAPAFASALTLQWTLVGNVTSFAAATGLADGETGMILVTLGGYGLPANPPSGSYKGAWTVTGTRVRVVVERAGSIYLWSADSLEVVA